MPTHVSKRSLALFAAPVLLIALAVFGTATMSRDVATHAGDQQQVAQQLLTAMLDQETGLRGYFQTNDQRFLEPWTRGLGNFQTGVARARGLVGSDHMLEPLLERQAARGGAWQASAQLALARFRATGRRPAVTDALERKTLMDAFRAANANFAQAVETHRNSALNRASLVSVAISAGLAFVLTIAGLLFWRATARRAASRAAGHAELRDMLQVSASEEESRTLLVEHIQRMIPRSGAAVLNRNHSGDRLEPTLAAHAGATPLRDLGLHGLRPRSCMAARLSRPVQRRGESSSLMPCEVCGKIAASIACEPLLVGGDVIGSVLVASERRLSEQQLADLHVAVAQAAPILGNQRTLALAETRATSDLLTGLPNRRAAEETIRRMLAHASRTMTPLSAILIDLDRFKKVNDTLGHEAGDRVLAAIGATLTASLRASDFAARYGGEEFLVLLSGIDRTGTLTLAEKLRAAIVQTEVAGVGPVSASLGVAMVPDDAGDAEGLLRKADRALYQAKSSGRNRVEMAESAQWPHGEVPAEGEPDGAPEADGV